MAVVLANVSFGALVFGPIGWGLMLSVFVAEWVLLTWLTTRRLFNRDSLRASIVSNSVSGIIGIAWSTLHNGGWWLVLWIPWVSGNELEGSDPWGFFAYFIVACFVSIGVECVVNLWILGKHGRELVIYATIVANLVSSVGLGLCIFLLGAS